MARDWLLDADNQLALYSICMEFINRYAPEEEPLLEEIFPEYLKLAEKGDTTAGTSVENAFAFSGQGELLVLVVLPAVTTLIGSLLASQSTARIADLQKARKKRLELEKEALELANQHLPRAITNDAPPDWMVETFFNPPQQPRTP